MKLTAALLFCLAVALIGRAVDHQISAGSAGAVPLTTPAPVATGTPAETYQGKPAVWWARRAVQARKDANARARTIERLRTAQLRTSAHFFGWLAAADCVQKQEASWHHNGPIYDGGMQADHDFQRTYAPDHLSRWGPAYNWPWWAQLEMAYRGWLFRGWQPWPNTARECGLL